MSDAVNAYTGLCALGPSSLMESVITSVFLITDEKNQIKSNEINDNEVMTHSSHWLVQCIAFRVASPSESL